MKRKLLLFLVLFCVASVTFAKTCTITWVVNGETVATTTTANNGTITIYQGAIPPVPNYDFVGWTTQEIDGTTSTQPTLLRENTKVQQNTTYYAVFESNEGEFIGYGYKLANALTDKGDVYVYACDRGNGNGYIMPVNNLQPLGNTTALAGKQVTIADGIIMSYEPDCEMNFAPGAWTGNTVNPNLKDPLSLYYSNVTNRFEGFTLAPHSSSTTTSGIGVQYIPFEASVDGLSVTIDRIKNFNLYRSNIPEDKMDNYYMMLDGNNNFVLTNDDESANVHPYVKTELYATVYMTEISRQVISLVAKSGDYYYGTFSSEYDIIIPTETQTSVRVKQAFHEDNSKVVTFENITPGQFNKISQTGNTTYQGYYIPAGKGVLIQLMGSSNEIYFRYTFADNASNNKISDNNKLIACTTTGRLPDASGYEYFKLAFGDYKSFDSAENDLLGFWWGADNGGAFNVKKGTAVLKLKNDGNDGTGTLIIKGFSSVEDDEVNAISAVESKKEANAQTYNLAGQRVDVNTKGIVIKNGKKYLNK